MELQKWLLNSVIRPIKSHSSEILTGMSIAGGAGAIILGILATPEALRRIEKRKEELQKETLTPVETVKATWKCYVTTAVTGAFAATCAIGAHHESTRKIVALNAAYTISEAAANEYQKKVAEVFGEKEEQKVRDEIAKDRVKDNPVAQNTVIITEKGNFLCYDSMSGRYFRSSIDQIEKAAIKLSRQLLNEMYVSLNEFYYELGLSGVRNGDDIGWSVVDGSIEPTFSSQIAEDGSPCIVLDYRITPRHDYRQRY